MEENRPSLILGFKSLPILNSYKIKDIISNIEKLNKEVEITLDNELNNGETTVFIWIKLLKTLFG
ncbi:hypothetical protein [Desnuesiella massiliensis]|uniref:hypothetical protein n=1 Tax=Desnuesiella massiliensis TaxID=1650662 RepID=UPI0012B56D68|nr:hypothetical protein [Desnuesiella massiliensis]